MTHLKTWALSLAFLLAVSGPNCVSAKPASTSGGRSSYSKPAAPKVAPKPAPEAAPTPPPASTPATPPSGSSAYTKPAASAAPAKSAATQTNADRVVSRKDSQAAFTKLQEQKAAYHQEAGPAARPAAGSAFANVRPQPAQQVVVIREHYYGGWAAPGYMYYGAPHYGFWDTMFLYYVLSHAMNPGYSSFWYHHYDDPGMDQFRAQIAKQAQDNAELKAQVDQMQAQINTMSGEKRDPNYLPPDTPAEAAMATSLVAEAPEPHTSSHTLTYVLMLMAALGLGGGLYYTLRMRRPSPTW